MRIVYVVHWFTSVGFFSFHTQNPTQKNKNPSVLEHLSRNKLNQWFPQWLVCLVLDTIKTYFKFGLHAD